MEIIYLFLKEERKFKNQNLNFGSEYIFNYSIESNELNICKNELYLKNHYTSKNKNVANVLNVTSIIGQNGTGKTTILNFFLKNLCSGLNLHDEVIFAIKINRQIIIYHTDYLPIKNDLKSFQFRIEKLESRKEKLQGQGIKNPQFVDFGYDFRGFEDTDLIYFSNVFDGMGGMELKGLHNISTNYLTYGDFDMNLKNRVIPNNRDNVKFNPLYNYFDNELHRQISFIHKYYKTNLISFELPTNLTILIKNDYLNNGIEEKIFMQNQEIYEYLNSLLLELRNLQSIFKKDLEKQKIRYVCNIYFGFLIDFLLTYQSVDKYLEIKILFDKEIKILDFEDILKRIDKFNAYQGKYLSNDELKTRLDNLKSLLIFIWEIDNKNDFFKIEHGDIKINIGLENFDQFEQLYHLYKSSFMIRPFFDLRWGDISSGEKALLNIFSRFYSLSNIEKRGEDLKANLIILIDEGDLYLHPEWQKRFVKLLIDFLPIIFESKKNGLKRNLQIIFTTNSPIPVSDLLSYNTIFLENYKDENGKSQTIVKDSLNEQKETFASNIHTLLSDSFFVKGGLIGDFASDKLDEIIDKLIKRINLSKEEREDMRKLIHQVGEPVLKTKLIQMYNDRYNMDIHERLDNIEKKLDDYDKN